MHGLTAMGAGHPPSAFASDRRTGRPACVAAYHRARQAVCLDMAAGKVT